MDIKISSLVVGLIALVLAIFKFKDVDSKICFFWIALALLLQSFSNYLGKDLWVVIVAVGSMVIGIIQGIRKRDKTYILMVGTLFVMILQAFSLIYFKK